MLVFSTPKKRQIDNVDNIIADDYNPEDGDDIDEKRQVDVDDVKLSDVYSTFESDVWFHFEASVGEPRPDDTAR